MTMECKPMTHFVSNQIGEAYRKAACYKAAHVHMCVGAWGKGWCAPGGRDRTEARLRQSFLFSLIIY